ncbi:MAG: YqzL family protein [Clostridia bacterium]|nr:YqzL family protein [Clostridia bacterium]
MKLKDFSWNTFKETGDIDAYLLYKTVENNGNQREKEWKPAKQGELSQDGQITANQTVC